MEGAAERQNHGFGTEPRRDQQGPLAGQQVQRHRRRIRVTAGVNDQRNLLVHQFRRCCRADAEAAGDGAAPLERLGNQRPPPGALQQQAGQQPEHAGPEHDDPVPVSGPRIERHLQRRLDQRQQGRGGGIDARQRNQFAGPRRKDVLVRMEGENRLAGLRYLADARIPVGEGIGEGTAQGVDRVVQRQLGRDLAPVHQPFGATADARAHGTDKDLTGRRPRCGQFPDLHTARRGMK